MHGAIPVSAGGEVELRAWRGTPRLLSVFVAHQFATSTPPPSSALLRPPPPSSSLHTLSAPHTIPQDITKSHILSLIWPHATRTVPLLPENILFDARFKHAPQSLRQGASSTPTSPEANFRQQTKRTSQELPFKAWISRLSTQS